MSNVKKKNRTAVIIVRLKDSELSAIRKRAKAAKLKLSAYVRQSCLGD